jgi:hypothetical protein
MKNLNISDASLKESDATKKGTATQKTKVKKTSKGSIKIRWEKLTPAQKYVATATLCFLILMMPLAYILWVVSLDPYTPPYFLEEKLSYVKVGTTTESKAYFAYKLEDPNKPKTEESPINGLLFTKQEMSSLRENAPVAVMVNNHAAARPQSNLSKADIVFETEVESGITRYMALYWSNPVEKVGPIRSVRQYYLEWLSPYDPILIHDGYASSDDPEINAGGNMYSYGIKTISTIGAWREFDGVRFAPHNEYSSVKSAVEYAGNIGWNEFPSDLKSWSFKRDEPTSDNDGQGFEISFNSSLSNGGAYNVKWVYDSTSNTYLRYIGGIEDIDQENNEQISVKTVIVQKTDIIPTYDYKGHVIVDTIGSGEATILLDGKEIEAKWEKKSRLDRTMYYNKEGKEIEFNRGQIWIVVMDPNKGSFDIIGE